MATIKQIAELAGVSRGTVDRVLNNRGSVNANTAARVREIAEKLNYKPNKAGLMLAAQKKNLKIGVILFPDSNPFFSEVLEGVMPRQKNYLPIISPFLSVRFHLMRPNSLIPWKHCLRKASTD